MIIDVSNRLPWIAFRYFPQNLEEDCYILVNHNNVLSDTPFPYDVLKYIKSENKLYKEIINENGYFKNLECTENAKNNNTFYMILHTPTVV